MRLLEKNDKFLKRNIYTFSKNNYFLSEREYPPTWKKIYMIYKKYVNKCENVKQPSTRLV